MARYTVWSWTNFCGIRFSSVVSKGNSLVIACNNADKSASESATKIIRTKVIDNWSEQQNRTVYEA